MITDYVRDAAATAAIFGFFASAWFGWAQERPPAQWRPILIAGSATSLATALAGGVFTWLWWGEATALDADTSRAFGIMVGIEFALAIAGVIVLAIMKRLDLSSAWVALVVGLHLFPLAALFGFPLIYLVAAAVTTVALTAVPVARRRSLPVSAVTGLPTGAVLLAAALGSLVSVLVPV